MVSLKDVQAVPRGGWPWRSVAEAMRPVGDGSVVHLDEDLVSVMRKMTQRRCDHLAVVDGDRLAGTISRDDMQSLFEIRSYLGTGRSPPPTSRAVSENG